MFRELGSGLAAQKNHERRTSRINRGLAKKDETSLRFHFACEPDILAHHPSDLRITAQCGQLNYDETVVRRPVELGPELRIHLIIYDAR